MTRLPPTPRWTKGIRSTAALTLCASMLLGLGSCTRPQWTSHLYDPSAVGSIDPKTPEVRCHLRDGSLVVLNQWQINSATQEITGRGAQYNADRLLQAEGNLRVAFADIALLETNRVERVAHVPFSVLGVVAGMSSAVTLACAINPKACFGSCPTFYVDKILAPVAEGFSASIARTLEATDVDALWTVAHAPGAFSLTMRNEALESHMTDRVRILAAPRHADERVLQTPKGYVAVRDLRPPLVCRSVTGDCLPQLLAFDGDEWSSRTDGQDLAAREVVELELPRPQGPSGLVLATRNTLLNTFLFYQVLAWMAEDTADWLLRLDAGDPRPRRVLDSFSGEFAMLHVEVLTLRGWQDLGSAQEIGPIAREVQLLDVPDDLPAGPLHVRLNGTRGYWKIDQVALSTVVRAVQPVALELADVTRAGEHDAEGLRLLRTEDGHRLSTLPGEALRLHYQLPPGDHELFLESRGFYTEWLRAEWLPERNPAKLAQLFLSPAPMLRDLAPAYRKVEDSMERVFWDSRVRPRP